MLRSKNRVGRERFAEVMKNGARISTPLFLARYLKNSGDQRWFKLAVVVSKKISSKAVNRNNFKRRTRFATLEVIKEVHFPAEIYTIIFFIKRSLKEIGFKTLKSEVKKVFDVIAEH